MLIDESEIKTEIKNTQTRRGLVLLRQKKKRKSNRKQIADPLGYTLLVRIAHNRPGDIKEGILIALNSH